MITYYDAALNAIKSMSDMIRHRLDDYMFASDSDYIAILASDYGCGDVCCGAHKLAIASDTLYGNYVVKVPLFGRDRRNIYDKDYCAIEEQLYVKASSCGLGNFFARTAKVGYVRGIPVYLANKCATVSCQNISPKKDAISCAEYLAGHMVSDAVINMIEHQRTQEEVNALEAFVIDNDIHDLRDENWGVNNDGDLVIIDYSGSDE